MTLRCCKCGQQSSSSSSRSASSGSGSGGSGSTSVSSASASGSSGSVDDGMSYCENCNFGVSSDVYQFSWDLQDNCPGDPGQPDVGCLDNFQFPVQLVRDDFTWNPYFSDSLLVAGACKWRSTSVGGVSVDGEGQCSPWPAVQLAIGRETGGAQRYFALLYVSWYGPYDPLNPGAPATLAGILSYIKIFGELPPNCLASMDLDFNLAGGNYEEPPGGTGYGIAYGPGCNKAWGNGIIGENTFPSTITIAPLL